MPEENNRPKPPQPPQTGRKLEFDRLQLIGIPFLLLLPVLALFGVFGEGWDTAQTANEALAMQVTYPTRYRYKMVEPLVVELTPLAAQSPVTITVEFSSDYIVQFSTVVFKPDVKEITPDSYRLEVTDVPPGETRYVHVELQGERYGHHEGQVVASIEGEPPVAIPVDTWIFP